MNQQESEDSYGEEKEEAIQHQPPTIKNTYSAIKTEFFP